MEETFIKEMNDDRGGGDVCGDGGGELFRWL